jgi:cytochrome P450
MNQENFPVFEDDFFTPANLADSHPSFQKIRELGDVVWMPCINMFVAGRYDDIALALRAPEQLISGEGVAVNPEVNDGVGGTITTDGADHQRLKTIQVKPLRPAVLNDIKNSVQTLAAKHIATLCHGDMIEAMDSIATYLPVNVVADLVGIKDLSAESMLTWSEVIFDGFGPATQAPTLDERNAIDELRMFTAQTEREELVEGGWAWQLMDATERGELSLMEAKALMVDYVVPSLDTTIHATGELLYQLGMNPSVLPTLREEPQLIPNAIYEAVRLATPIRGFSRKAVEDFTFTSSSIPAGSRIWLLYASANRDERHYENPDQFNLHRKVRDQLGWGLGVHNCPGKHVAIMEMEALLKAMIDQVDRIEMEAPTRIVNKGLQGFKTLPLKLIPKTA